MNEKVGAVRVNLTHLNLKNAANFLSCFLAFFPSLFIDLDSVLGSYWILVIYIAALFLATYSISRENFLGIKISQIKPFLLWLIVVLICILNRNGDIARSNYRPILNLLFIFIFATLFIAQDKLFLKNILRVIAIYLSFHLVMGFYFLINPDLLLRVGTNLFNLDDVFYTKFLNFINNGAFMGFSSHYSTSGMYMSLAVILFAALLFAYRTFDFRWNKWCVIGFALFFIALGLTQKRAHLLFSTVAIIGMYLVGYVKGNLNRKLTQIIILILLGVLALILFFNIPTFQKVIARFAAADSIDGISTGRISRLWMPALEEFKKNPIFGMGWRQFKYLHPMSNGVKNDVHNIYIQFFAEDGIVGAGYIIGLMAYTYISTWKLLLKSKYTGTRDEYLYLIFSFGFQTFFILYGLTGNPFYDIQCFFPYMASCSFAYYYQHKYQLELKKVDAIKNDSVKKGKNDSKLIHEGIG